MNRPREKVARRLVLLVLPTWQTDPKNGPQDRTASTSLWIVQRVQPGLDHPQLDAGRELSKKKRLSTRELFIGFPVTGIST